MDARDHIICGLDIDPDEAWGPALRLNGQINVVKVGMRLLGPDMFRRTSIIPAIIAQTRLNIMLDVGLCESNTIAATACEIVRTGKERLFGFTVSCVPTMRRGLEEVVAVVREKFGEEGVSKVVAITVPTSVGMHQLDEFDIGGVTIGQVVLRWADIAYDAGIRRFVCGPRETKSMKSAFSDIEIITTGVRFAGSGAGPHNANRITTPAQAIEAGADYLVIDDLHTGNVRENIARAVREIEEAWAHTATCD
ncbi:MAG: hypothetical protein COX54_04295 [Candidatus Yonathbacteria bacterium CG23_combo_of_CG06-09_8_20_14_all_46_18]|nr:MAG: hypothetical protein COX54_04295 [Candidatus Yonathbacteria bacterium CG23_combo_of_CG06-09_8_20_14_all_46_18]